MTEISMVAGTEDGVTKTLAAGRDQVLDALGRLDVDPARLPRVPWDSLHDLIGPLWAGDVWGIAAATGNGKTTAAAHLIESWVDLGLRVYVCSLEQSPAELRTVLASLKLDLHPQRVLENRWDTLPRDSKSRVAAELKRQIVELESRLIFAPTDEMTVESLEYEMANAYALGAHVVVIDHVHHIDLGTTNQHAALTRFCRTLKTLCKQYQIPVLLLAQMNRGERDPVAPYQPPNVYGIQGGEVIRQVCSVAIGLYRPLVDTFDTEDARLVRTGKKEINEYVVKEAIGVHVMKHRNRGEMVGRLQQLHYKQGRIRCPRTEDRLLYEARHDL